MSAAQFYFPVKLAVIRPSISNCSVDNLGFIPTFCVRKSSVRSFTNLIQKVCENRGLLRPIPPEKVEKAVKPQLPEAPKVLEFKRPAPESPMLEKAGFFNKKEIEIVNKRRQEEYNLAYQLWQKEFQNTQIKNKQNSLKYEKEMSNYRILLQEYEKNNQEFYEKQMEIYQEQRELYEVDSEKILEEEITKYRTSGESDLQELLEQIDNLQREVDELDKKDGEALLEEIFLQDGTYKENRVQSMFYKQEIIENKNALAEQYAVRNKLLALNIIYPKYNNIVAWTTMCEYFVTGRCSELKGANGAYNLYESETRANIVIAQLDTIISQLEKN